MKLFGVGFTTGAGPAATGSMDVSGSGTCRLGPGILELEATTCVDRRCLNAAVTNGKSVVLIGTAYAEGARTGTGGIVFPYEIMNNTQIFKTPYEMTRTALKEPLRYDKTGAYKDMSKSNGIKHLREH